MKTNETLTSKQINKAAKTQVANETKKSILEILNIGKTSKVGGQKTNSIYVANLYNGIELVEERKKIRRQIRKKLERDFLSQFLMANGNQQKLAEIAKYWAEYAPNVYRDIYNVYDGSDTTQKNLCERFCAAMKKIIEK